MILTAQLREQIKGCGQIRHTFLYAVVGQQPFELCKAEL